MCWLLFDVLFLRMVRCLLSVVDCCRLLFDVCCLLLVAFVARSLLVAGCSMFVVRSLLPLAGCSLFVVCCALCDTCCLLCVACGLSYVAVLRVDCGLLFVIGC